jgi:hypothetical protein
VSHAFLKRRSGAGRVAPRLAAALLLALSASACRQDMHDAPKYEPLEYSDFFKDHRASRQLIQGTIARGQLKEDKLLYTGHDGDALSETFPFPVTKGVLDRGQERFNIYCTPCHSRVGDGNGMVAQRGFKHPPSFHDDRLRSMPPGYFVSVMTNGFATMPSYALQVKAEDRWAIAAYIKALQLSHHASASDLTPEDKLKVDRGYVEASAPAPAARPATPEGETHGE